MAAIPTSQLLFLSQSAKKRRQATISGAKPGTTHKVDQRQSWRTIIYLGWNRAEKMPERVGVCWPSAFLRWVCDQVYEAFSTPPLHFLVLIGLWDCLSPSRPAERRRGEGGICPQKEPAFLYVDKSHSWFMEIIYRLCPPPLPHPRNTLYSRKGDIRLPILMQYDDSAALSMASSTPAISFLAFQSPPLLVSGELLTSKL